MYCCCIVFFYKPKTAYEMLISDWISDVCASDLSGPAVIVLAGNVPGHASSNRGCGAATWATACGTVYKVGPGSPGSKAALPRKADYGATGSSSRPRSGAPSSPAARRCTDRQSVV